jgi:hypothetical protein
MDTSLKNQPVGVLARCGGHPIQHTYCLTIEYYLRNNSF